MCFGSSGSKTETPAAAPAAPEPAPTAADIGGARKAEEQATFGSSKPSMRADRTVGGSLPAGGSGLVM